MTTPSEPKRRGRKPGPILSPDEATKPRSIRLNEARWAKLQRLGRAWLEHAIDRAKDPLP